ncbi:MAG: 5-(carboxyamino)imidazole ribonucleotide mutase [Candidatus Aminicenantes bacterium]|nr:5-(carboxyamino)imidazole ribonucleotide mutase [Candidatus Aminicenantes bacterium]
MKVAVFIGSESDFDVIEGAVKVLKDFDVPFLLEVTSAHRTPERTEKLVREFESQGGEVIIAAAGMAAHLAGVIASHTILPVIGIPVGGSALNGLDALLATVQMPKGMPVACMAIGKHGAINAALLAVQILGLHDDSLKTRFKAFRRDQAEKVEKSSEDVKGRV